MSKIRKFFIALGILTLTISISGAGTASAALTIDATSVASNGVLTIAAGGTNQNITLTPSGTGYTILNGNVRIGTTSLANTLDVYGTFGVTGTSTFAGNLNMTNSIITNIGNIGTDFTSTGGLTLAGDLDIQPSGSYGSLKIYEDSAIGNDYIQITSNAKSFVIQSETDLKNKPITVIGDMQEGIGFWSSSYFKVYGRLTTGDNLTMDMSYISPLDDPPYFRTGIAGQTVLEDLEVTGSLIINPIIVGTKTIFLKLEHDGTDGVISTDNTVPMWPAQSGGNILLKPDTVESKNVIVYSGLLPSADSSRNIGSSAAYWLSTYTDNLYLNSTATLDGATAGEIQLTGSLAVPLANKTAAYTAVAGDNIITCDATAAPFSVTLPASSGITGRTYTIKKIDSGVNAVTVDGNAAETIDGATTYSLATQYKYVTVVSDGTNWIITANN